MLTNLEPNVRDKVYCILHPDDYQAKGTSEQEEDDEEEEDNYENEEESVEEEEDA